MEANSTESSILSLLSKVLMNSSSKSVVFSWHDYILFTVTLFVSALIGIYFGCFGKGQNTESEYLLGGRQMKVIPIAVSLTASHISGITLLAVPAEVYKFGASTLISLIAMVITALVTIIVYLPVFFNLNITSTNEYLERRFDKKCRMLASFLFALNLLIYLPIVVYIPALAFSAVTEVNICFITTVVCGLCIFYTAIGGLKAIVWADTIQFTVTITTLAAVLYLGIKSIGGLNEVWEIATQGERTNIFDMTLDITSRDTFWPTLIGFTTTWIGITANNQGCIQKFLSLPTLKEASISVVLYSIACNIILTCSIIIGLIMYAYYEHCDPFSNGDVDKDDLLLPHYVMDVGAKIPGLPGLFIAGVFCTALSTFSAHLNCLAGTIYEDFISERFTLKESTKTRVLKLLVVLTGIMCTGIVFVIDKMEYTSILMMLVGLNSIATAPVLGLFTLGVLCPFIGKKGAFYGTIVGLVFTTWLVSTSQHYVTQGYINDTLKPVSTKNCVPNLVEEWSNESNPTIDYPEISQVAIQAIVELDIDYNFNNETEVETEDPYNENWEPFILFRISTMYYGAMGFIITILAALLFQCFDSQKDTIDLDLISPAIHFLMPQKKIDYKYDGMEKYLEKNHITAYGNK